MARQGSGTLRVKQVYPKELPVVLEAWGYRRLDLVLTAKQALSLSECLLDAYEMDGKNINISLCVERYSLEEDRKKPDGKGDGYYVTISRGGQKKGLKDEDA